MVSGEIILVDIWLQRKVDPILFAVSISPLLLIGCIISDVTRSLSKWSLSYCPLPLHQRGHGSISGRSWNNDVDLTLWTFYIVDNNKSRCKIKDNHNSKRVVLVYIELFSGSQAVILGRDNLMTQWRTLESNLINSSTRTSISGVAEIFLEI